MELVEWLDDLCVRFIINLPQEELQSVERICFQVEEAQWFYEDFVRPLDTTLPSLNLRQFCLLIFQHCPLLASYSEHHHLAAFEEFLAYKTRVPVRGAIMLNAAMNKVLLVKGWKKSANWSFPRGKINKDEKDLDCAVREVYEETGYDLRAAGLAPEDADVKYIEVTMREQHVRLYVFRGVPEDTPFQPRTRKEISKIQWYELASLPGYRRNKHPDHANPYETVAANKLYMVAPFLSPLKKWIAQQRKKDNQNLATTNALGVPGISQVGVATDDGLTDDALRLQQYQHHQQQAAAALPSPERASSAWNDTADTSHLQNENIPTSMPILASSADASAQLKRLLSVEGSGVSDLGAAGTSPAPNVPNTPNAANLLALLRQRPAEEPVEPVSNHSGELPHQSAPSYHQQQNTLHYRREAIPHTSANMSSPPDLQYLALQTPASQQQHQPSHLHDPRYEVQNNAAKASLLGLYTKPTPNAKQASQQVSYPEKHASALPEWAGVSRLIPDSQAGHDALAAPPRPLPIPSPSEFPPPRLSNHAMNLLNAFKNPQKPPAGAGGAPPVPSQNLPSSPHTLPVQDQGASQMPFERPEVGSNTGISHKQPMSKTTTQQNVLLDLFRAPSKSPSVASPQQTGAYSAALLQGHVELPTVKSPDLPPQHGLSSPPPHPKDARTRKDYAHPAAVASSRPRSPRSPQSPARQPARASPRPKKQASPRLTSATVAGPLDTPDFGSHHHKRSSNKHQHHHRHASNTLQNRSSTPQPTAAPPIQILRRPTTDTSNAAIAGPARLPDVNVSHTAASANDSVKTARSSVAALQPSSVAQSANGTSSSSIRSRPKAEHTGASATAPAIDSKTFQPQILRRPQQATAVPTSVSSLGLEPSPSVKEKPSSGFQANTARTATAAVAAPSARKDPSIEPAKSVPASSPKEAAAKTTGLPFQSAVAAPPTIVKRSSTNAPSDHKQNLLSLFGQPKASASYTSAAASAALSPLPIAPGALPSPHYSSEGRSPLAGSPLQSPNTGPQSARSHPGLSSSSLAVLNASGLPLPTKIPPARDGETRASISSIASTSAGAGGASSTVPVVQSRSRIGSMTSARSNERRQSGSQTPISSTDRGLLLNFLDGVVKNATTGSTASSSYQRAPMSG